MQPRAAEAARVVGREHAHDPVLVAVVLRAKVAQAFVDDVERLGLVGRPRHPRPQVVEASVDGVLQERRILGVVAAEDETLGLDPYGVTPTRSWPAAST